MTRTGFSSGILAILAAACVHTKTMSTSAGDVAVHHAMDTGTLTAGAVLEGRLDHSLTPSTAKVGEPFSITLASDATTKQHATIVPAGALIYGHVLQLDMSNTSKSVATVQLAFDSLVFAGHQHVLDANISKIGAGDVAIRPLTTERPTSAETPASVTLLSFANADGQIPAGSMVTLIVTNPILMDR